ncbi:MAG: hypothetical protein IID45_10765 [Planctomycetes bacterium]|nr:hypothetical protein [Planctomycetota bacterium]
MMELLKNLDRRWIFLMMFLAVLIPTLFPIPFPEKPSQLAQNVFDEVEKVGTTGTDGGKILLAFDFDPPSEGELGPMATAFVRHCCEIWKQQKADGKPTVKLFFIALWPVGPQMIDDTIAKVIKADFPEMVYGEDYVNLGFKSGQEAVIKVIVTDLRTLYTTDAAGTNIDQIPMAEGVDNIQAMDLIINVSAGYPGTKEWVQYAKTPYPNLTIVAGCTGVQAPLLYPYIPEQLPGLLGAIKGAAEYEALVVEKYDRKRGKDPDPKYLEGKRRMGPQLIAHMLMILLIIVGNIIFFVERSQQGGAS